MIVMSCKARLKAGAARKRKEPRSWVANWRVQLGSHKLMLFAHHQVQLSPRSTGRHSVLCQVPFIFALHFQPDTVNDDNASEPHGLVDQEGRQVRSVPRDTAEIGDGVPGLRRASYRGHEPFGLAQRQLEDLADEHGALNRMIRIHDRSFPDTRLLGAPWVDRFRRKPNRDVTAPSRRWILVVPVRHFVAKFFDLVASALVDLARHQLFCIPVREE